MLPSPPPVRVVVPAAPAPPPRAGFPWAATLAPVVVSLAIWGLTGSPFGLLFAALGPVVAVAGLVDGARSRRRTGRRDSARHLEAVEGVLARIAELHAGERMRRAALCAAPGAPGWGRGGSGVLVRTGTGPAAAAIELEGGESPGSPESAAALARLRRAVLEAPDGPVLLDLAAGAGVVGPPVLARAVARGLAVQVAAARSPADTALRAPVDEPWAAALPHAVEISGPGSTEYRWRTVGPHDAHGDGPDLVIAWAGHASRLPSGCGTVLDAGTRALDALSSAAAGEAAALLADRAVALGVAPAVEALPASVALAALLSRAPRGVLAAPIGVGAQGAVELDLATEGPHALVGGTTGSGKSELLVSWVLGMAAGRSADDVTFVLVDFKGGAAFAPLAALPHVLATLSDLDAGLTRRAVESLRAELLRRERLLAEAGARSVDELPRGALARLVVVVDEFAALVAAAPALHETFSDLAARGRSLGIHLVLCTQRPSGVVRDAVLANVGLRIALRVTDRGDSIAVLGDPAASRLPAEPRGRALVLRDGELLGVQVPLATSSDVEGIARDSPPASRPGAPWHPPLPRQLDPAVLAAVAPAPGSGDPDGIPFGLADLPSEQRQPVAVWHPQTHGPLLVVGASGSGVSTALATIATAAAHRVGAVEVLPSAPADAWQRLQAFEREHAPDLLVIDDLDVLLGRLPADHRVEFADRLAILLRSGSPVIAAGARRLDGSLSALAAKFGSRLVLRQASRDDHLLTGADASAHDPAAPPGRGHWRGADVQVAHAAGVRLTPPPTAPLPAISVQTHPRLAVVAARPRASQAMLADAGWRVRTLGEGAPATLPSPGERVALLGDPDAWNADWALLVAARRELPIALLGCTAADHRALLRTSQLPPPPGDEPAECWLATEHGTVRARIAPAPEPSATQESAAKREMRH